jgi:hypothetical protein
MQPRTRILSAFTLSAGMAFGAVAMAADMPKEGTFTGAYTGWGTYKATQIGPDRLLVSYDQNGVTLTNGFTDHMVWRCWGTADTVKGVAEGSFYCTGSDPVGDQLVYNCANDKHPMDQKAFSGSCSMTTGTGKYAGVSGSVTYGVALDDLRPMADGAFAFSNPIKGSYKLP